MKYWILLLLAFTATTYASKNTLLPNGRITFTMPPMGDSNAFSFLGEFGEKVIRGSGNYGVYINADNRIKFTGELLLQDLAYHFTDEAHKRWMTQYAVGADYQYLFLHDLVQSIDFSLSFSHAFNRGLNLDSDLPARVAGSDAVWSSFGSTINLWDCGYFSYALTYDYVKYLRHYEHKKLSSGVGATLHFIQYLPLGFSLDVETDFRRPYYFYSGIANWHHNFCNLGFDLGAYVNYTNGRASLPNALVAGLQMSFAFGSATTSRCSPADTFTSRCESTAFCDLAEWAMKPAIYMPIVMAIADQTELVPD